MSSTTLEATSAEARAQTISAIGDPIRLRILAIVTEAVPRGVIEGTP